jgi:hypothetical protein
LQRVGVDRLLVKVVGAERDRLQRVLLVAVAGNDNHLGVRGQFQEFLQGGETFFDALGVRWQPQVLQHDHRVMPPQFRDGSSAVLGRGDVVILEAPLELRQQPGVVLDDQELSVLFGQDGPFTPKRRRISGLSLRSAMLPRPAARVEVLHHRRIRHW